MGGLAAPDRQYAGEASINNGCWTLVMNLGPVKHEESFGANIFLLRVHSLLLGLSSMRAGLILSAPFTTVFSST